MELEQGSAEKKNLIQNGNPNPVNPLPEFIETYNQTPFNTPRILDKDHNLTNT